MSHFERTLIMIKPDAVHRNLIGQIIQRFEQKGFKLVAMKFMQGNNDQFREHYIELKEKDFYDDLIEYMNSGPVVPMVWEGFRAVQTGRTMLGSLNSADSAPGTIRGDLCLQVHGFCVVHGSDSLESAEKEIAIWFTEKELINWKPTIQAWICHEEQ